jgi:hypothetical protein
MIIINKELKSDRQVKENKIIGEQRYVPDATFDWQTNRIAI